MDLFAFTTTTPINIHQTHRFKGLACAREHKLDKPFYNGFPMACLRAQNKYKIR